MLELSDIDSVFTNENDSEKQRILLIVNAYLSAKNLRWQGEMPQAIKQAGVELAQGFIGGELLQGRTESVVASKSVKAGDVSSSKTFSTADKDRAMGQHEMIALALIEPYVAKFGGMTQIWVNRG
ncbi:Uncharacterised protein [Moraxella lacunata]|uniref:Protein singed n=1 Tax=Moraxella lacunata TaxID=477 RepID=A0A378T424_MORLA|nr:hypothetical protein [Moraxella lacunata]STZ55578.1 Uncharacterised protein [Moraxella lacunata]